MGATSKIYWKGVGSEVANNQEKVLSWSQGEKVVQEGGDDHKCQILLMGP